MKNKAIKWQYMADEHAKDIYNWQYMADEHAKDICNDLEESDKITALIYNRVFELFQKEDNMPQFTACGLKANGKVERVILSSFDAARAYAIGFKKRGYLLAYVESEGAEDPKILYMAKGE